MAIKLITGVLGAGKTFYAVRHLLYKYFNWDKSLHEWVAKKNLRVLTNIAGCKVGGDLLREFVVAGGFMKFFTIDYQRKFVGDGGAVYIVDEAQMLFDERFYNKEVFSFFQWCRHMGIDIYLITQDVCMLPRGLRNISEYEIRAVRRSYSFGMGFRYNLCATYSSDIFQRISCKKDARVFAVYQSAERGENETVKSLAVRQALFAGGGLLAVGLAFVLFFSPLVHRGVQRKAVGSGGGSGSIVYDSDVRSGASNIARGGLGRVGGGIGAVVDGYIRGHDGKVNLVGGAVGAVGRGEFGSGVRSVSFDASSGSSSVGSSGSESSEGSGAELKFPRWVVVGQGRVSCTMGEWFCVEESDGGSWVGKKEDIERVFRLSVSSPNIFRWGPLWLFAGSADDMNFHREGLKGAAVAGGPPPTALTQKLPIGGPQSGLESTILRHPYGPRVSLR